LGWEIKGLKTLGRALRAACGGGGSSAAVTVAVAVSDSALFRIRFLDCFQHGPVFTLIAVMLGDFHAFQFAKKIYWACKVVRVSPVLRDQLLRASSSVALNIAEGSGKRTPQDQRRFYSIALGSLRECEAVLALEEVKKPELFRSIDSLGAILYTLTTDRRLSNRNRTETAAATATGTLTDPPRVRI
jgi:four helix bundle protein